MKREIRTDVALVCIALSGSIQVKEMIHSPVDMEAHVRSELLRKVGQFERALT